MSAEKTTRAVGYIRVASGSQRKRERSVYIQRQEILRYAAAQAMRIVRFFADDDCIADIALRQGLSNAMAFIENGRAQAIAVAGMDLRSATAEDLAHFAQHHRLLSGGPALIAVKERLDTRTMRGRITLGVFVEINGWKLESQGRGA